MENKTLTAVELLFETMQSKLNNEMSVTFKEMFEQALALEKEQILHAVSSGFGISCFETGTSAEQYYTSKYGKQ